MQRILHQYGDYAHPLPRIHLLDERLRRGDCPALADLARDLGVSPRTLQRDCDFLRYSLGAPLVYDRARGGWRYDRPGFFVPLLFADREDLSALLILGQALAPHAGSPLGTRLDAAYHKLLAVFKGEDSPALRAFVRRFCFAAAPGVAIDPGVWQALMVALQRNQRLGVEYQKRGRGPVVARDFDAWGVIVRLRDWFVHGWCHLRGRETTLFLPWVRRARLLDGVSFEVPPRFDLAAHARSGFQAVSAAGAPAERVVLRFAPEAAGVAEGVPLAHRQRVVHERDGGVRVEFETSALFQVEREVLSWGAAVEVLAPSGLRARVAGVAEAVAARYAAGGREAGTAAGRERRPGAAGAARRGS